jgi:hypothetical protein
VSVAAEGGLLRVDAGEADQRQRRRVQVQGADLQMAALANASLRDEPSRPSFRTVALSELARAVRAARASIAVGCVAWAKAGKGPKWSRFASNGPRPWLLL